MRIVPGTEKAQRAMAPRTIGNYQYDEVLGVGAAGTVYLATDLASGQEVALKVLSPGVSHDSLIKARFEREMMILQKLNHPNMVQYLGGGEFGEQLYYAMEALRAGTVKELLEATGRFTWQETAECGRQIASVLQYAHNHSIIHRDLKTSNLFITDHGKIKLGDFGIARDTQAEDLTATGITVGTYAYMSPEQILGQRHISGKSDLYSLGCVLFEMLTGRVPFEGENFHEIVQQHLHRPPPSVARFVPDCPAELGSLVHQLLAKNPDQRPFNARWVQGVLDELLRRHGYTPMALSPADTGGALVDVPADQVLPDLTRRLEQKAKAARPEVSWFALAAIFLLVVAIAGVAVLLVPT
jgi:serine/threonine protein kinase